LKSITKKEACNNDITGREREVRRSVESTLVPSSAEPGCDPARSALTITGQIVLKYGYLNLLKVKKTEKENETAPKSQKVIPPHWHCLETFLTFNLFLFVCLFLQILEKSRESPNYI